jgi:CRISPR type III-B/RAMP module-associated protein Cmr5
MRRDLEYAKRAWEIVDGIPDDEARDFPGRAQELPMMLRRSGLAATVAFLKSKSGDKSALEKAYGSTLRGVAQAVEDAVGPLGDDLLKWLSSGDVDPGKYRLAAREAAEYALWMKRIAEARFGGTDEGVGEEA